MVIAQGCININAAIKINNLFLPSVRTTNYGLLKSSGPRKSVKNKPICVTLCGYIECDLQICHIFPTHFPNSLVIIN